MARAYAAVSSGWRARVCNGLGFLTCGTGLVVGAGGISGAGGRGAESVVGLDCEEVRWEARRDFRFVTQNVVLCAVYGELDLGRGASDLAERSTRF